MKTKKPILYDWKGQPIHASYHQIEYTGAKRTGSLRNWSPRRIYSDQQSALERETLIDRAIDLVNNNPHAAGVVDTFSTTIIGGGLQPYPNFTPTEIGFRKTQKLKTNNIKKEIRQVVKNWWPFADAGERMNFGMLQFQAMASIVQYGECLFLLPMIDDGIRPYQLALQSISPLRLKTPTELKNDPNVKDGIEIGRYGQPRAYYIKKTENRKGELSDNRENFVRIMARQGHRQKVIHIFYGNKPEQIRGIPWFTPAIKFFRDIHDYLDAELVSNVVTAAFSMFVEVADMEPEYPALDMADITDSYYSSDGTSKETRYEELIPGVIRYGNPGEKPHVISAQRPGATFEPFVTVVEKAIAKAVGLPHPVLFKDFKDMNYASYRSAMLEAWRVFRSRRQWFGSSFCQIPYRMLLEEAWLKNEISVNDFYPYLFQLTSADWIGPPKGQIEPVKEIQADEKAIELKVKSRREVALERSADLEMIFDDLSDEQEELKERGLLDIENPQALGN